MVGKSVLDFEENGKIPAICHRRGGDISLKVKAGTSWNVMVLAILCLPVGFSVTY